MGIRRHGVRVGVVVLLLGLAVASARADEAPDAPTWYGWQTVAVDLGAGALIAIAVREESGPVFGVGAGLFVLGGPLVHLAHHDGRWWTSLSWRLGLPLAGVGLGALAASQVDCHNADSFCRLSAVLVLGLAGAGVGAGAAVVVDGATLGRATTPTIMPLAGGGMIVGLSGAW